MEEVEEDEYLGDVISIDGKNKKNIKKRLSRGLGIISEIMNLLKQVSFGHHYVEIALLLSQSLLLGSILNNVEIM